MCLICEISAQVVRRVGRYKPRVDRAVCEVSARNFAYREPRFRGGRPPDFRRGVLGGIMGWGGWRDKAVSPPFGVVSDTNGLPK